MHCSRQLDEAAIRLVDLEDGRAVPFAFRGQRGDRAADFRICIPPSTRNEALTEANRCLNCFDAPCAAACPTHIDVPRFIKKIATENLMGSALTILDANVLGASCSRVCPVEVLCEGACVMLRYNKQPIAIGRLQRHAMDHFLERGGRLPKKSSVAAQPENRVHRRGSGVSRLCGRTGAAGIFRHRDRAASAARRLEHVRRGRVQTARARQSARSGDDRRTGRGVPLRRFRSKTRAISRRWKRNTTRSSSESGWAPCMSCTFRARIIPTSSTRWSSSRDTRRRAISKWGIDVVVVGAGNTAIDAANAARRLGAAHVTIVYRTDGARSAGFRLRV